MIGRGPRERRLDGLWSAALAGMGVGGLYAACAALALVLGGPPQRALPVLWIGGGVAVAGALLLVLWMARSRPRVKR